MCVNILSLFVAALAVVVSPIVFFYVSNRQIRASLDSSKDQIVAPMRQKWINSLRDLLAEFMNSADEDFLLATNDERGEQRRRLNLLLTKIEFMLNPREKDHERLRVLTRDMVSARQSSKGAHEAYPSLSAEARRLSKTILKRECDRVKEPIAAPGADSASAGKAMPEERRDDV